MPGNGAAKVGGDFIMLGQTPGTDKIVLTAYGLTGNLLGTAYVPSCNVSDWATNFYGIKSSDGSLIKSVGIDYSTNNNAGNPGVANLIFEPAPEPGTFAILMASTLLFVIRRSPRKTVIPRS